MSDTGPPMRRIPGMRPPGQRVLQNEWLTCDENAGPEGRRPGKNDLSEVNVGCLQAPAPRKGAFVFSPGSHPRNSFGE
jgi:hypothetical protein